MNLASKMKQLEIKVKKKKEQYVHNETPIVEFPEELKEKYGILPYPIMGGLSAK